MIPHLRDSVCMGSPPPFSARRVTLSPWGYLAAPTYSITSVALQCDGAHKHNYTDKNTHTQHRCQCAFAKWIFVFLPLRWRAWGIGFGHCSPSEGKTYRLLVDFKGCLLFLEDVKGKTGSVAATQTSSCPPPSVSLFCSLQSWVNGKKKKLCCMLYVQYMEAETRLELFTVHNVRMCLKSLLPHTMNHLYFL